MDSLRPIEAAENAAESVKQKARGQLIKWLDHHECDCGSICEAKTDFVERQAMIMEIWECPDCGNRYYRDSDEGKHSFSMWNR
jgi:ribosomal protein L37AE/L43A